MEKRTRRLHTQLEELTDLVDSLEIDRFLNITYSIYHTFVSRIHDTFISCLLYNVLT